MELGELKYEDQFYLNKERYKQFIRPKPHPERKPIFEVVCYKVKDIYRHHYIRSDTEVKPVLKLKRTPQAKQ